MTLSPEEEMPPYTPIANVMQSRPVVTKNAKRMKTLNTRTAAGYNAAMKTAR